MYDEQLNLTKSYTTYKSFETTKEFKELKFKKKLGIKFTKNDKLF